MACVWLQACISPWHPLMGCGLGPGEERVNPPSQDLTRICLRVLLSGLSQRHRPWDPVSSVNRAGKSLSDVPLMDESHRTFWTVL